MKVRAAFVTSAVGAEGCPKDGLPEVALVGRSNVGKSTLVNALARQKVARTSAAPGKTRLINVYRIEVEGEPHVHLELGLSSDLGDHNHAGCLATAMHVVNAIPAVVQAEPGVVTMLDLPVYSAHVA